MPAGSSPFFIHCSQEERIPWSYKRRFIAMLALTFISGGVWCQSVGNSGSINGSVVDPTGAVVPNATVEIRNPVSGFDRSTTTDSAGKFALTNIPFNPYHLTVTATRFG